MLLYKFFKQNCYPCKTLSAILKRIQIPETIQIVEIDLGEEENKHYIEDYKLEKTPTLVFEDGRRLDGVRPTIIVEKFINGD